MRAILLAVLIAALPAATLAQQAGPRKPEKPSPPDKLLPLKGASSGNGCAAYGPGFVRVEGSGTCVKIGGAVSIGAGAR